MLIGSAMTARYVPRKKGEVNGLEYSATGTAMVFRVNVYQPGQEQGLGCIKQAKNWRVAEQRRSSPPLRLGLTSMESQVQKGLLATNYKTINSLDLESRGVY